MNDLISVIVGKLVDIGFLKAIKIFSESFFTELGKSFGKNIEESRGNNKLGGFKIKTKGNELVQFKMISTEKIVIMVSMFIAFSMMFGYTLGMGHNPKTIEIDNKKSMEDTTSDLETGKEDLLIHQLSEEEYSILVEKFDSTIKKEAVKEREEQYKDEYLMLMEDEINQSAIDNLLNEEG